MGRGRGREEAAEARRVRQRAALGVWGRKLWQKGKPVDIPGLVWWEKEKWENGISREGEEAEMPISGLHCRRLSSLHGNTA